MDGASITELYRRFGPVVYRRCLRLLQNPDDAKDATQQVFIKLLQSPRRFDPLDEALPWMVSVASNHCFNLMRDSKRRGARLEGHADKDAVAEGPDREVAQRQLARQVLEQADPLSRELATGALVKGQGQEELAKAHGISDKTVQRKVHGFLESARKFLSRHEEGVK